MYIYTVYVYIYTVYVYIYTVYVYIMYRHILKYLYRHITFSDHEFLLNAWSVCTHSKGITKCFWC